MAKTFRINAMYEYEAEIVADNEQEAERIFLQDLNSHYVGTYSMEIDEIEDEEDEEGE